jgi:DNA-binding transcriptional MerR regulator
VAKGPEAFRTISEAAAELNVPQHVLRFWETKFSFIRPMKRAGGRRFYRPQDVAVLRGVRRLLHDEGYTIKGVQRLHKEQGIKRLVAAGLETGAPAAPAPEPDAAAPFAPPPAAPASTAPDLSPERRGALLAALADLEAAQARLEALLRR